MAMQPNFPLYIVSKGRWEHLYTHAALTQMRVPHFMIVEAQELELYARGVPREQLLVLDPGYKQRYETCDDYGLTKSTGSGPARNFAWEHSISGGFTHHWVMDDNIRCFYRLNNNLKTPCTSAGFWRAMEDFCCRYENVAMAGPQYEMFCLRKEKYPAFATNTRIYSCNLIRNDLPYRWRGRYNEDTDLSLRMLKDGWCTILFNAFLQDKLRTQKVPGGNTAELYANGTLEKSQMLERLHPDVARVVKRYGRDHHFVDYTPFKNNRLKRKPRVEIPEGVNEYGMELQQLVDGVWRPLSCPAAGKRYSYAGADTEPDSG